MSDTSTGTPEPQGPHVERTVAFIADPRATTFLMRETVSRLVGSLGIQRGLVDPTTLSGVAVALTLEAEGVPYDLIDFGQGLPDDDPNMEPAPVPGEDVTMAEAPRLREAAAGTVRVELDRIGSMDANLMLIPAVREGGSAHAEFAVETLPGLVLSQAEQLGLRILVMCPPEQGVRRYQDGPWVRQIMHVTTEKEAAEANRARG
ncbi:hypothetical protein [Nocardiopsis prasina]|uniref:hypothetical protein n=1 Tax=Nocardiopsis prasina TaxID=2015 RepID=UPI000347D5D8|nr:hypothetical protein [Nocardiopsis prasina]